MTRSADHVFLKYLQYSTLLQAPAFSWVHKSCVKYDSATITTPILPTSFAPTVIICIAAHPRHQRDELKNTYVCLRTKTEYTQQRVEAPLAVRFSTSLPAASLRFSGLLKTTAASHLLLLQMLLSGCLTLKVPPLQSSRNSP